MNKKIVAVVYTIIAVFMLTDFGLCAEKDGLYGMFKSKPVIKTYISEVTNSSGDNRVDIIDLRKKIEDALTNRKSLKFGIVDDRTTADIIISCDVNSYYWNSTDPVDMVFSSAAVMYDLMTVEDYAYIEATFTVKKTGHNRTLWHKELKVDLTKPNMNMEASIPLINEKAAKIFMRDCFSKKRSRID
jgi:hypothetical protein